MVCIEICEQLIIRPLKVPGSFVCKPIEVAWNEVMQRSVAMMTGVQELQLQKIGSRACGQGGTFAIPDDGSAVVVSCSNGELHCAVLCSNHIVMCHCSHELKVTVGDHSLGVGESDQGVLCPLFVRLTPQTGATVGSLWCQPGSRNEVGATHSQSQGVS